jgi:ATP-dependent helicase YprA (DUF1998 family)
MNAQPNVTEELSDDVREQLIDAWTVILAHEIRHDYQYAAMCRQRELIEGRSRQQVERMERERGLR